MSFKFENFNSNKKTMKDNINLDSMGDFVHIREYIGKELKVEGFFFTKSKYGEQVVIIADNKKINIPKRFTEDFKQIRDNAEALDDVLNDKLMLVNIRDLDAENGKTVTFDYKTV